MTDLTVANTILAQLGGRKFLAMTGAKNLTGSNKTLSFQLPSNLTKVNCIRVTLTAMDDYMVEGLNVRGTKIKPVALREGIYCENLQSCFETMTGLRCSL